MTSPLVLSLFPGIGLLDMAFELEGFTVVRGPDVLWGGDVRTFHPPAGKFEGVIGGPPCQAFSALAHLVRANGGETRFGNLIPEFERCIREAQPQWFLMENVPGAPVPAVDFYGVRDFVICNSHIAAEDGLGQEQMRKRRWSFGLRGKQAPDLRRWIKPAALLLPEASRTVAVTATEGAVAVGGSGKAKHRQPTITGAHQCSHRPKGGHGERRTLPEMCRLQGLPEDFLDHAPFTMQAKRSLIANGVPRAMGRAVARAVLAAIS